MTGIELIAQERQKQIENFIDDSLDKNVELWDVAINYAWPKDKRWILDELHSLGYLPHYFPKAVYKGLSRIRELTKAGAAIAAEIDRIQAIEGKEND